MASINAKGHHHEWQSKPPDGKLEWSKSWDEEEMAANFMYSSSEEISRLKNLLKQDPGFENSSSWPHLTECCSTCSATRSMKLVGHYGQFGNVPHSGTRKFQNPEFDKSGSFDNPTFLYIPNDEKTSTGHLI